MRPSAGLTSTPLSCVSSISHNTCSPRFIGLRHACTSSSFKLGTPCAWRRAPQRRPGCGMLTSATSILGHCKNWRPKTWCVDCHSSNKLIKFVMDAWSGSNGARHSQRRHNDGLTLFLSSSMEIFAAQSPLQVVTSISFCWSMI
jgi:hypothetical protein